MNKYVLYSRKMGHFPQGLTHDFGQKFELSSLLAFYLKKGPRNYIRRCSLKKRSRPTG